jgi:hypothetical protein
VRPICCGKKANDYRVSYGRGGTETGFHCRICKRIRIPSGQPLDRSYMESLDTVRLSGIAFDATL